MKFGLLSTLKGNNPDDQNREWMARQFFEKLGLEKRDVIDVQPRNQGRLGSSVLVELREENVAQYAFSKFFNIPMSNKGYWIKGVWLTLQPKNGQIAIGLQSVQNVSPPRFLCTFFLLLQSTSITQKDGVLTVFSSFFVIAYRRHLGAPHALVD